MPRNPSQTRCLPSLFAGRPGQAPQCDHMAGVTGRNECRLRRDIFEPRTKEARRERSEFECRRPRKRRAPPRRAARPPPPLCPAASGSRSRSRPQNVHSRDCLSGLLQLLRRAVISLTPHATLVTRARQLLRDRSPYAVRDRRPASGKSDEGGFDDDLSTDRPRSALPGGCLVAIIRDLVLSPHSTTSNATHLLHEGERSRSPLSVRSDDGTEARGILSCIEGSTPTP